MPITMDAAPPDTKTAAPPAAAPPSSPPAGSAPAAPSWRESLPEDLRSVKTLEKFADPGALAKSYIALEQAHGKKLEGLVKVPVEGATAEEVTAYRRAVGAPESVDGYKVAVSESLQPYVPEESVKGLLPLFHKLHLPAAAVQEIVQGYAEMQEKAVAGIEMGFRAQLKTLEQEWGAPVYTRRVELAKRALHELGSEALVDFIDSTHLGSHPEFIKFMAKVGESMAEDGHIDGRMTTGVAQPEALRARKAEIESDPDFMSTMNQVKHEALVKEWREIYGQLNPEPIK